jgi:hypothetical protein
MILRDVAGRTLPSNRCAWAAEIKWNQPETPPWAFESGRNQAFFNGFSKEIKAPFSSSV